jgi:hypothetical protein
MGDCKAPGPPMTLGNAAAAKVRLIVWCKACQHQIEPGPPPRWLLDTAPGPRCPTGAPGWSAASFTRRTAQPLRNRWFVDSPLEEPGFELLVRGRGEAGCRAF